LARVRDDHAPEEWRADEMVMKPIAKPVYFNPFLGMAVKGMWSTTFTQAVVEAVEQDDPEPAPESEAA
jgi:hypothetical protein